MFCNISCKRDCSEIRVRERKDCVVLEEQNLHGQCHRRGQDKEAALAISKDMEDIIEREGFHFKATVMSGHPPQQRIQRAEKETGDEWDTEKYGLSIDIKLNYGEKVKGANVEEDAGIEYLEAYCSLPFWRVHEIKRMYLAPRTHGLFIT